MLYCFVALEPVLSPRDECSRWATRLHVTHGDGSFVRLSLPGDNRLARTIAQKNRPHVLLECHLRRAIRVAMMLGKPGSTTVPPVWT